MTRAAARYGRHCRRVTRNTVRDAELGEAGGDGERSAEMVDNSWIEKGGYKVSSDARKPDDSFL